MRIISHHQIANPTLDHQGDDPDQDPGVIPDLDLEVIILTQVHPIQDLEVDPDPDLGLDLDQEQGGRDLDHKVQIYPEDGDLHHFLKKGGSQVQENDPFHIEEKHSVTKVHHLKAHTVLTPDQVDLIPVDLIHDLDLDQDLVHMNVTYVCHGQEVEVVH